MYTVVFLPGNSSYPLAFGLGPYAFRTYLSISSFPHSSITSWVIDFSSVPCISFSSSVRCILAGPFFLMYVDIFAHVIMSSLVFGLRYPFSWSSLGSSLPLSHFPLMYSCTLSSFSNSLTTFSITLLSLQTFISYVGLVHLPVFYFLYPAFWYGS